MERKSQEERCQDVASPTPAENGHALVDVTQEGNRILPSCTPKCVRVCATRAIVSWKSEWERVKLMYVPPLLPDPAQ